MLREGHVHPERVLQRLLLAVAVVIALGLAADSSIILGDFSARGLFNRFTLGSDSTVPTYFSAALLCVAAVLLRVVARSETKPGSRRAWLLLAILFLAMAIDEVARLHEWLGEATEIDSSGFFYHPWVYFGIAAVVAVGVVYLPFVLRLPPRLRFLVILSAAIFVAGGLGMEMMNADLESSVDAETAERWAEFGTDSFRYALQTAAGEALEMVGVAVLVYALLDELRRRGVRWLIALGAGTGEPATAATRAKAGLE
ncbi:MAG TPA: hypothetical protein PLP26_03685 [Ilumatobacteraceae bacterium]|jgi:hypothetical protein|nr:hypothetical protein [Ilumatobacteraceae bacterium]HRB02439.1 hypothetical protein [Ilumatobacteraceae bacterium]